MKPPRVSSRPLHHSAEKMLPLKAEVSMLSILEFISPNRPFASVRPSENPRIFAISALFTRFDINDELPPTLLTSSKEARNVSSFCVLSPRPSRLSERSSTATELTSALSPTFFISFTVFVSSTAASAANRSPTMPRTAVIAPPSVIISIVSRRTAVRTKAITFGATIITPNIVSDILTNDLAVSEACFHAST